MKTISQRQRNVGEREEKKDIIKRYAWRMKKKLKRTEKE